MCKRAQDIVRLSCIKFSFHEAVIASPKGAWQCRGEKGVCNVGPLSGYRQSIKRKAIGFTSKSTRKIYVP
mgnify:CR=1 FL=1